MAVLATAPAVSSAAVTVYKLFGSAGLRVARRQRRLRAGHRPTLASVTVMLLIVNAPVLVTINV